MQRINQKTTIVYFYFTSSLEVRSDPTIIFRSWLSQLAELDADIFKLVHGKRRSSADMQVATRPIIQDLLREAIKHDPRCHLAVDGLDECTSTKLDTGADVPPGVASFLETTISLMERPTRLLVVSRRIEEIWDALSHQESVLQLEVTEEHTLKDCGRLARWITTRNLAKKKPDIRQDVSKAMMQKSGGQLLWIHLAGAGLRSGANRQSLLRSIEATPHKLFEVYEHIWQSRIAGQPRSIELLRWVIFAWRPLTVQELTAAALIREGNEDVYEDEFPDEDDEWDEVNHQYRSGILQPCGEFLQLHERVWELCGYDNERGNWGMMRTHPNEYRYWIVTPAHDTVREFLHRKLTSLPVWQAAGLDSCAQEDWARPAGEDLDLAERQQHHILGRLCLRVVQSCPTWQEIQFCSSWYIAPSRRGLGLYSAARGFRHLSTATLLEEDSGTMENLLYFLDDRNQTYHDWSDWATTYTLPPQGTWELAKPELSRAKKDPILCAAILSLEPTTSQLLQRFMTRQSPEIVKQKATEMLNICCSDVKITMLAIDAGADPNNPHPNRFPALTISCVSGRLDIAALLLAAGADVRGTTEDTPSRPFPICFAAASGQWDSFQLLSRHGADLRSTWGGCTLMHFAANSDCIEVAEFLLGQGMVDMLCAVDDYGRTPLGVAAAFSSFKVAQFLVRNGVGVSEEDEGDSLVASAAGSISVMADLLNNNRYINPAPADAKMKTTELLISHGAKINGRSRDGITGLLAAAMEGQYDVMEFLLGKGADATMRDADDSTAWSYLARGYWHLWRLTGDEGKRLADIVDMLVGAGLGIDAVDGSGSTPLIMAARLGHAILTNVLLCKGANIDAVNYAGETAVNSAAGRGHLKVVEYLVSMEADINIPDAKGRSPATNASIGGHAGVVGFLAEHGAVVDEAVLDGERLNQDRNDTNVEEYKAISRFIRRARCLDGTI